MSNEEVTLLELYSISTKQELLRQAKNLDIKIKSTLRKTEIAEIIVHTILDTPTKILDRLPWSDLLRLQTMVHAEDHGALIHRLSMLLDTLCLIWITDSIPAEDEQYSGLEIIYPDVVAAFSPVIDEYIVTHEKDGKYEREQLIIGLLNIYGVLTFQELEKLYVKYYPKESTLNLLEIVGGSYLLTRLSDAKFAIFASPFLEDFESDLEDLAYMNHFIIHKRKSIRQATFTKEEVLAAGISEFPMPPMVIDEKIYAVFNKMKIDKEESDRWISYMWMATNQDNEVGDIIKVFFDDLQDCSREEVQSVLMELMDLINCFPRWILKGNTPNKVHEKDERRKMQKQPPQLVMGPNMKEAGINISQNEFNDLWEKNAVHITPKAGRNDPCPCGSGKKYKHCCGSN